MADVSLRIKPFWDTAGLGGITRQSNLFNDSLKKQDQLRDGLLRGYKNLFKEQQQGFRDVTKAANESTNAFKRAFSSTSNGLQGFSRGVDGLIGKFTKLKTIIAASVVALAAKNLYDSGKEDATLERRTLREFGPTLGKQILARSQQVGNTYATSGTDALKALRLFYRAANSNNSVGDVINTASGAVKIRTQEQADRFRLASVEQQTRLYGRIKTLYPELDNNEVALRVTQAVTENEGVRAFRSLIPELEGNQRIKDLTAANERGDIRKKLSAEQKIKYANELKIRGGKTLSPLTLTEIALEMAGASASAAEDERKTPDFEARKAAQQIGEVENDISMWFFKKVNKVSKWMLGKSGASSVGMAAEFAGEHIGTIASIGGGLLGTYALGRFLGRGKGGAGGMGGLAGAAGGVVPVFVTNQGFGGSGVGVSDIASGARMVEFAKTATTTAIGLNVATVAAVAVGLLPGAIIALADSQLGFTDWIAKKMAGVDDSGVTRNRGLQSREMRTYTVDPITKKTIEVNQSVDRNLASGVTINVNAGDGLRLQSLPEFAEHMASKVERTIMENARLQSAAGAAPMSYAP